MVALNRPGSRRPTIDGRRKPDLPSYTGVSTFTGGTGTRRLAGTSVAAAHVTGAAALLFRANPSLDASQAQSELTWRAYPPGLDNDRGNGLMELLVSNSTFFYKQSNVALTPLGASRTLDVRNNNGFSHVGLDL
ncbi:S8 family serine peptidase [Nonomuraea antimicrobica]|uniref:S8 family serine peptidase n=1 Tax=Nonomuraea antimicrobica TaxID=561173 RepID=UPI0031F007DD